MAASARADSFAPYEQAGALLLSKQPPVTTKPDPKADDWGTIYSHLEARLGMMRTWRWSWWSYWSALARVYLPHRYHWVVTANTMNRGRPVNDQIIDSTGTLAMRICAAGMLTGLMSPSRPWFRLGPQIENFAVDEEGQRWLDDSAQRIYSVLAGSNFYTEASQLFQDVATFGTSVMLIYEDDQEVIRCYVPCAGEYFLAAGARLAIDTLYREFTFTVAQIVEWFQLANCPQEVRTQWEAGGASLEREYIIAHAIEPNFALSSRGGGDPVKVVPGGFAYREVYWLRGQRTGAELSRRGFNEAPFMPARWSKTSNDPYGRGPGMDAYGDTAQLQIEQRRKSEYIEKMVRPPMVGDVSLKNQPSSILPGDITYVDASKGKQMFMPAYEVNPTGMAPLTADIKEVQNRINRCFFTDVFLMISQMEGVQPRNELELAMRQGEKIQLLGPVIELFESESANKAIVRVASIMHRRGMLAPAPASLRGVPIAIEYVSIMKLAQRAAQTAGMEQMMKFGASMAEAAMTTNSGLPNPLRIVDMDETYRQYADAVGNPAKLMFTRKQVAESDQARAHAAAQQQAMAALPPAVEAAKNLGQIDVGGGQNAVQAMISGAAGNAPTPAA